MKLPEATSEEQADTPDESLEIAITKSGSYLVNGRAALLLVNDREWKPDVAEFTDDGGLTVQGWQDDRSASLMIQRESQAAQIERIGDRPLAMEMAQRLRARAAGQG